MDYRFRDIEIKWQQNWKADKDLKSATLGYCVLDAKTSTVVAEYNSHQYLPLKVAMKCQDKYT